ncbi:hypothetical protein BDV95DRAFT_620418 [Massariosphaeria phaeospora]|uniref:Uncharacterized protein n=1 Tax=Massariosphaeria phaeospora TaxID=100035 RepID=A0A7C8I3G2_9PLEO|nr:hypothetical protein BDV95DRAFT_620418 [Massariosphaeria phaeospora]
MKLLSLVLAAASCSVSLHAHPTTNDAQNASTSPLVERAWRPQDAKLKLRMGEAKQHVGSISGEDMYWFVRNSLTELCTPEKCTKPASLGDEHCCNGGINMFPFIQYKNKGGHSANNAYLKLEVVSSSIFGNDADIKNLMFMTIAETYKREVVNQGANCYAQTFTDGKSARFCNVGQKVDLAIAYQNLETRLTFNGNTEFGTADCADWKEEAWTGLNLYKPSFFEKSGLDTSRGDPFPVTLECCDAKKKCS